MAIFAIGKPVALDASADERDTRVHLDHDHVPVARVDRELDVGSARVHAHGPHDGDGRVAHALVFLVGERKRRGDGDRVARVYAHRVNILDRADHDHVVAPVAHHLQLEFLPAGEVFLDQNLPDRRLGQPVLDQELELARRAARPPPVPPSVYAGRIQAGSYTCSSTRSASSCEHATPERGTSTPTRRDRAS